MLEQYKDSEEIINLLINLLNKEQDERQKIAADLHAKKSNLAVAILLLGTIEKDVVDGKFKPENVKEIMSLLSTGIDELREVCYDIFPKSISMSGLNLGLKEMVRDGVRKYNVTIECITNLVDKLPIEESRQVGIYRICKDLLEYFQILKYTKVVLNVTMKEGRLEVEMSGIDHSSPQLNNESEEKLTIFKGRIIQFQGIIDLKTNWSNFFKFSFNSDHE